MKLWHLLAIGGVAYLLLRKPTPTAITGGVVPAATAEQLKVAQEAAAAAAAGAAAAAAGAGVPGAMPLPLYGIGWVRV